jgi:hypothetical protein
VSLLRREPKPLPPSEPIYPEVPWADPSEVAPPLWRRMLSIVELSVLVVILGVLSALAFGAILAGSFLVVDYLIS